MGIEGVSAVNMSILQEQKTNSPEAVKAVNDFKAILFEQMLANMISANVEQEGMQQEVWWDLLTTEVAKEIALSSDLLTNELLSAMKEER